jgi:type I restriction enzyme S subunit
MPTDEAKRTITPKLRFPEFRAEHGWAETFLGAEATFQKGRGVSKAEIDPKGSRLCIRYGELYTRYGEVIREVFSKTNAAESTLFLSRKNDVIVPGSGETKEDIATASCVLLDHVALGGDLNVIRTKHNGIFLSYFLNGPKRREIAKVAQGDTVVHLYPSQLEELPIAFPTDGEQQKIADCLTSLDEVIAAQGRKVEALKAHKKGLMQRLFPREGETLPRLRFPEFGHAPEWDEVDLGEVAEIKLGKMLSGEKHTTGRLLPYLNNISLRWNTVDTSNLPRMYFDDDELDRFGLTAGDVVVCEGGEPGRSAVWDGRLPDLKFQKAIHRVRFNVPFEPRLLVLYLETIAGTTQFEMLFTGGGIKHLTRETFARLKIPLVALPEQQRIADCLSSLAARIAAEAEKLAGLKTHKKGLMQRLFPSAEGD